MATIINAFSQIVGVVNRALGAFNSLPGPIRNIIGVATAAALVLRRLGTAGIGAGAGMTGLGGALSRFAGPAGAALLAGEGLRQALNSLDGSTKLADQSMSNLQSTIGDPHAIEGFTGNSSSIEAGLARQEVSARTTAQAFAQLAGAFGPAMQRSAQQAVTGFLSFGRSLSTIPALLGQFAATGKIQLTAIGTSLGTALQSGFISRSPMLRLAGTALVTAARGGLLEKLPQLIAAGGRLGEAPGRGARGEAGGMRGVGSFLSNTFGGGVESGTGKARSGGRELGAGAKQGAAQGGSGSNAVGTAIGQGFASGISSMLSSVVAAAVNVVQAAIAAAKSAAQSKSPSKLTYRLGQDVGAGFALGMDASVSRAVASARGLALSALGSLQVTMATPALAGPAAAGAAAGTQSVTNNTFQAQVAGGGNPDPDMWIAQMNSKVRALQ
jgi:hypothetical protein